MRSTEGKNIVLKSSDITDIIQKGVSNLPELNSFSDINPMINLDTVEPYLEAMTDNIQKCWELNGYTDDDEEKVYEIHSNASDVFYDDFVYETDNFLLFFLYPFMQKNA